MAIEITDNEKPDVEDKPASLPPSSLGERRDAALAQPLKLLEAKINQVQSRWHAVEEQLSQKDRTIAGLRADLDARAEMIKRLEGTLALAVTARESAEDASAASQAELSHLESQLQQQTDMLIGYQEKLTAATGEYQVLQEELDSAYGQIDGLRDDLERHREVAGQIDPDNGELYASEDTVEHAVKHLEQYIRQREEDKSASNDQLFQYADALADLERRVAEQDTQLRSQREDNDRLEVRNEELGNLCADRDATIESLNQRLEARIAEIEAAREEVSRARDEVSNLEETVDAQNEQIENLRHDITQRDSAIQGLEEALDSESRFSAELEAQLDEQGQRLQAAESRLAKKLNAARELEIQLSGLRDRITQAEADLASRTGEVATLETTVENTARALQAANENLQRAERETDELKTELREARALNAELEESVSATRVDREVFEAEMGAQQLLINELENDLARQQQKVHLLDTSVDRITTIAASLETLDRQMAISDPQEWTEHVVLAGEEGGAHPFLMLERQCYALDKPVFTIGRSKKNDIHLQSLFTSRFHARLLVEPSGQVVIEDLDSRNGVRVNGEKISRKPLSHEDRIWIGERELVFYLPHSPAEETAAS